MQKSAQLCHLPIKMWVDMVVAADVMLALCCFGLVCYIIGQQSCVLWCFNSHECCIKLTNGTTDVSSYTVCIPKSSSGFACKNHMPLICC